MTTGRNSEGFTRATVVSALIAGAASIAYSLVFVAEQHGKAMTDSAGRASASLLLLSGLVAVMPLIALFRRLHVNDEGFAVMAFLFGTVGALGAAVHGGHDLALAIHPPTQLLPEVPNELDPRGLLTFGAVGLGLIVNGALIMRGRLLTPALGAVGVVLGVDLVLLFMARLTVLDSKSLAIVIPAVLGGLVLNPVWFGWLAIELRRH